MSNMTNDLEGLLRSFFFRNGTMNKPTTLAIGLTSGVPNDALTPLWELQNAGSYARQALSPSDVNWSADNTASGQTYNNSAITFPAATADWGWVSGAVIFNNATYNAGSGFFWGSFTTPKLIQNGDTFTIPVSGLSIRFD